MSAINVISSLPELNKLLAAKKERLTVIDFHATWCGPCKAVAPKFEQFANQYRNVTFVKVDVDQAQDIARAYGVSAMPTFVFVKNERKVHQVRGADVNAIEAGIKQYSGSAGGEGGAFPGQGQTLSGTPVPTEAPPPDNSGYVKLAVFLILMVLWFKYAGGEKKGE
ncbi:hypothetical protein JCM6882_009605 [Rhodosporidiobolus microsporus]